MVDTTVFFFSDPNITYGAIFLVLLHKTATFSLSLALSFSLLHEK